MNRRRWGWIVGGLLALIAVGALAAALIGATDLGFRVASEEGEAALTVETELPAATCRKVLTRDFPWVRFACEPRPAEAPSPTPSSDR